MCYKIFAKEMNPQYNKTSQSFTVSSVSCIFQTQQPKITMLVDILRPIQLHINWITGMGMNSSQPFTSTGSKAPQNNTNFLGLGQFCQF